MAELLRIKMKRMRGFDEYYWFFTGKDSSGSQFTSAELLRNIDVPDDLEKMEVVLHSNPATNRFEGTWHLEKEYKPYIYDDPFVFLEVLVCSNLWNLQEFPDDWFPVLSPRLAKLAKRLKLKTGDKVWVQIEYD